MVPYLFMLQKYINSKQKNSEIKDCTLYLGNISKKFTINNMKKMRLGEVAKIFSVDLILLILMVF